MSGGLEMHVMYKVYCQLSRILLWSCINSIFIKVRHIQKISTTF